MEALTYTPRLVDGLITSLLTELSAVMIVGPRASGKTTTAARHASTIVSLDRRAEAAAFHADPDAALRGLEEPVLLDEWQATPGILGAVKRSVDRDPRPGRYLITGSVRADLEGETWPGTGRLVRVLMFGLTGREVLGDATKPTFFQRLRDGGATNLSLPQAKPDLRGYAEMALTGGFPEPALRLSEANRQRWFDSYVELLLTRDAEQLTEVRDPGRLRRYFETLALNTAGVVDHRTLYDAAGINRKTANAYDHLLQNLLIIELMQPWRHNRLSRLVHMAKRYVIDPALAAGVLRVDVNGVLRDGDLLGRLLDTYVAAQLRPEAVVDRSLPRLYHLRQQQGRHEVDLLAELGADRVIGIEVKATSSPGPADGRHLQWLRDAVGDRFVAGIVFHTGPGVYELGHQVTAVPICALWG
jgi:predicted AAA+ superfamily ATPase